MRCRRAEAVAQDLRRTGRFTAGKRPGARQRAGGTQLPDYAARALGLKRRGPHFQAPSDLVQGVTIQVTVCLR